MPARRVLLVDLRTVEDRFSRHLRLMGCSLVQVIRLRREVVCKLMLVLALSVSNASHTSSSQS